LKESDLSIWVPRYLMLRIGGIVLPLIVRGGMGGEISHLALTGIWEAAEEVRFTQGE
jgi:hypothetical protein